MTTDTKQRTLADAAEYLPRVYNDLRLVQAEAIQAGDRHSANLAENAALDVATLYHRTRTTKNDTVSDLNEDTTTTQGT